MADDFVTSPYLTEKEVSARYHIPKRTLTYWREKRQGPKYYRLGRMVRYSVADMDDFIDSCAVEPSRGPRPSET